MREINTEREKKIGVYLCMWSNRIGVLARISGMMSGKSYNISSITVGVTRRRPYCIKNDNRSVFG